jgi:chemotaxis protein methyltransferase CheR
MQATTAAVAAQKPKFDAASWSLVRQFMLRTCGVELREDQGYLLDSRLMPAAKANGFISVADYVAAACRGATSTPAAKALIDAMTTHETMFYRDSSFWKSFEDLVLPTLVDLTRNGGRARIWSAACSTGQEPYSLVMLLDEKIPDLAPRIDVVATDVAELSVERARKGFFTPLEVNRNVNVARLMKHFVQAPGGFQIREELRRRITFQTHNLLGANPDPTYCHVVLCRNVLIYFGDTDRASVMRRLAGAATRDGFIALGSTETWREGRPIAPGWYQKGAMP